MKLSNEAVNGKAFNINQAFEEMKEEEAEDYVSLLFINLTFLQVDDSDFDSINSPGITQT